MSVHVVIDRLVLDGLDLSAVELAQLDGALRASVVQALTLRMGMLRSTPDGRAASRLVRSSITLPADARGAQVGMVVGGEVASATAGRRGVR